METDFVILRNGEEIDANKAIETHQALCELQRKKITTFLVYCSFIYSQETDFRAHALKENSVSWTERATSYLCDKGLLTRDVQLDTSVKSVVESSMEGRGLSIELHTPFANILFHGDATG